MTFGFGFGLPHYTYTLGVSPSGETYFLSVVFPVAACCCNINIAGITPNSVTVDSAGNATVFGYANSPGAGIATGTAVTFSSSGTVSSTYPYFNVTAGTPSYGTVNPAGGFYATDSAGAVCCTCPCTFFNHTNIRKLNAAFSSVASNGATINGNDANYSSVLARPLIGTDGNLWTLTQGGCTASTYISKWNATTLSNIFTRLLDTPEGQYITTVYPGGFAIQPSSGNVILAGYYQTPCVTDLLLQSINYTTGGLNWSALHNYSCGDTFNAFHAVTADASDNIYALGQAANGTVSSAVFKFNSSGAIQSGWGPFQLDGVVGVAITTDSAGNVYVVGNDSVNPSIGNAALSITKITPSRNIDWTRKVSCTSSSGAPNGGYVSLQTLHTTDCVAVKGTTLYVPLTIFLTGSGYPTVTGLLKIPTDGTHTKSLMHIGPYYLNYVNGSVTPTSPQPTQYTFTTPTNFPVGNASIISGGTSVTTSSASATGGTVVL